ncbi:MAG: hypothetical protein IKR48_01400 [Kiritimatiellae bacterium]|nr:hypothetical protein [Kiritimatiellia bacterium]
MNRYGEEWRICRLVSTVLVCGVGTFLHADSAPFPMPPETGSRETRFQNPPPSARILPIRHNYSDDLGEQDRALRQLAEKGFGGWAGNVSFQGYVDDESKWPSYIHSVKQSRAAGMALWLYDECGYPSGSARDLTLRGHPELETRGLLVAVGEASSGGSVTLDLPPGKLLAAKGVPVRDGLLDLSEAVAVETVASDGRLVWRAPEYPRGSWHLFAMTDSFLYESTHAQVSLAYKKPYINLLMKEATERFIAETHERYAAHLGTDLGKWYASTFTDEPSLMSYWFRPMPYYVLPLSPELPKLYRERTGRDLLDDVPAIVGEAGKRSLRDRFDFWNLIGDLVSQNYFGTLKQWCNAHGFHSGGHLLMEESIEAHVPLYGDFFRCLRLLDAPSIDCLQSLPPHVPWQTALFAGSVAELDGDRYVMCEASDHCQRYRPKGDTRPIVQVTEAQILGSIHRLIWGGVNTFTSYYNWTPFDVETVNRINRQVGRCITLQTGCRSVADIAVLYPAETLMSGYQPQKKGAGGALCRRAAQAFQLAGRELFLANRCFLYVDSQTLTQAKPERAELAYRDLRWKVVILPCARTLPLKAWQNLHAFWKAGGAVIALDLPPQNSTDAFPSEEVQSISREIFGSCDWQIETAFRSNTNGGIGVYLTSKQCSLFSHWIDRLLEPHVNVRTEKRKNVIRTTHRRGREGDVFFLINDSEQPWEGTIAFCEEAPMEQWNPVDGSHRAVVRNSEGRIPLSFAPYGAVLFTTPRALTPKRLSTDGEPPNSILREEPIRETPQKVTLGARQKDLETRLETGTDTSYPHRSVAKVVTSSVDTFCFTVYRYGKTVIPQDASGLIVSVRVPQRQDYAPNLLVFVTDRQGGRYLANTLHPLSQQGEAKIVLSFTHFVPFGETKGELNPQDIVSVEIGWGGYFGTAGETIELETCPPSVYQLDWLRAAKL